MNKSKLFKKYVAFLMTMSLLLCMPVSTYALGSQAQADISTKIGATAQYLMNKVSSPTISSVGGEWTIIGLGRSNMNVPQSYYDKYEANVVKELKEKKGVLTKVKYTEYSRLILALTAMGKNPVNVGGYNLFEKLSDFNSVTKQGINGPIYALIALDSKGYTIPKVSGVPVQTTRQLLIDYILAEEVTDASGTRGGFALSGTSPDPDITGMALQALARYQDQPEVKAVVDRALKVLDSAQLSDGNFSSWGDKTSESLCQVIIAKAALGIDPAKNVQALYKYSVSGGGFEHIDGQGLNLMATEQGLVALASYERYLSGVRSLYDMRDVTGDMKVALNGKYLAFDQPPVNEQGRVLVPMRAIFESLGAKVLWDQESRTVKGTLGQTTVELTVGDTKALVNGAAKTLDVPAKIINGRTLVPVRFVSESLDASVGWYPMTRTVTIQRGAQ